MQFTKMLIAGLTVFNAVCAISFQNSDTTPERCVCVSRKFSHTELMQGKKQVYFEIDCADTDKRSDLVVFSEFRHYAKNGSIVGGN